jgi:hypothetical protein
MIVLPMIPSYGDVQNKYMDFLTRFVDLKVVGWRSYSQSLDTLTSSFFHRQIQEADERVDYLGRFMKTMIEINRIK